MILAKIVENGQISCNYYFFLKMATFGTKNVYSATNPKKELKRLNLKGNLLLEVITTKLPAKKMVQNCKQKLLYFFVNF